MLEKNFWKKGKNLQFFGINLEIFLKMKKFVLKYGKTRFHKAKTRFQNAKTPLSPHFPLKDLDGFRTKKPLGSSFIGHDGSYV